MKVSDILNEGLSYINSQPQFSRNRVISGMSMECRAEYTVAEIDPGEIFEVYPDRDLTVRYIDFGPNGLDGRITIHEEEWEDISDLQPAQVISYTDEMNIPWRITHTVDGYAVFETTSTANLGGAVPWEDMVLNLTKEN